MGCARLSLRWFWMVLGHWKNAKVETNKDNKVLDPFAGCRRRRQSSSAEYAGKLNMKRVETRDFTLIALFNFIQLSLQKRSDVSLHSRWRRSSSQSFYAYGPPGTPHSDFVRPTQKVSIWKTIENVYFLAELRICRIVSSKLPYHA